jgi:hypothetical protein
VMMVAEKGIVLVHEPLAEEDESRPEGAALGLRQP